MNREEAIAIIRKEYLCVDRDCDIDRSCGKCDLMVPSKEPILEAYKMAIKALEQMPVTTTAGEGGVIYYPQVEGVTPTVIDAGKQEHDAIDRKLVCAFIAGLISDDGEREKGLEYIRNMPLVNPQPCEDAISRQAVLDILKREGRKWGNDYRDWVDAIEEIKNLSSVNPTKTGHWIHVSERLPEDIKPVIVTWKNTDPKSYYQYIVGKHFIGTAHYKSSKWYWYSRYGKCDSEEFDEAIEVVAWMPLPQPYKGVEE